MLPLENFLNFVFEIFDLLRQTPGERDCNLLEISPPAVKFDLNIFQKALFGVLKTFHKKFKFLFNRKLYPLFFFLQNFLKRPLHIPDLLHKAPLPHHRALKIPDNLPTKQISFVQFHKLMTPIMVEERALAAQHLTIVLAESILGLPCVNLTIIRIIFDTRVRMDYHSTIVAI